MTSKESLGARTVLFVKDAPAALAYYTDKLGFTLDWTHEENGAAFVFQVSLQGLQVIINQVQLWTVGWEGHGRVFTGGDDPQVEALKRHILDRKIPTETIFWGGPTLVLRDLDGNEFFFWFPGGEVPAELGGRAE